MPDSTLDDAALDELQSEIEEQLSDLDEQYADKVSVSYGVVQERAEKRDQLAALTAVRALAREAEQAKRDAVHMWREGWPADGLVPTKLTIDEHAALSSRLEGYAAEFRGGPHAAEREEG